MSLFDLVRKQFIEVIDWTEPEPGILVYRFPMIDREIRTGGKLTVRESQLAMFVNEGKVADVFAPGLYTLNTQTLPVLTSLQNWDKLFASPFKSDVYFFSTREQIDQKWGTPTALTIRDKEFGPMRIRAFGNYSYHIQDPKIVYAKLSGSLGIYRNEDIAGQLRAIISTNLGAIFGHSEVGFVDMTSNQAKFSDALKQALMSSFQEYGLALDSFLVQSISLPEELQAHFDKLASMNMLGDLQRYMKFQTADSISTAAANPGGVAGAGAGLGAGLAMAQAMTSSMGVSGAAASVGEDPAALLEKIHELLGKGIITQAEYDTKKQELLKRIQ